MTVSECVSECVCMCEWGVRGHEVISFGETREAADPVGCPFWGRAAAIALEQ